MGIMRRLFGEPKTTISASETIGASHFHRISRLLLGR